MLTHTWLTFGMSNAYTPGFQDTSRLMTQAVLGNVGYIEPPKPLSAWKQTNRRMISWAVKTADHMTVLSPPLPVPRKVDPLRIALRLQAADLNRRLSQTFGTDWRTHTTVYVTNWSYYHKPLIEQLQPKHLVFDIVDDVLAFPYDFPTSRVLEAWKWLANHASVNVAVSPVLQQLTQQQLGVSPIVLPNGVDAAHFASPPVAAQSSLVSPTASGIRVGFAGTMNHWIDFTAMHALLDQMPDVHLYLMGRSGRIPDANQHSSFQQLEAHERAHFVGNVPYEQLPAVLHQMDVLLLPRIPSAASESSSPLKLYEYLAVGKPIVISGVPVPADMKDLLYVASGSLREAMSGAKEEVRGERPNHTQNRQVYAGHHTWEARVKAIQSHLQSSPSQ